MITADSIAIPLLFGKPGYPTIHSELLRKEGVQKENRASGWLPSRNYWKLTDPSFSRETFLEASPEGEKSTAFIARKQFFPW